MRLALRDLRLALEDLYNALRDLYNALGGLRLALWDLWLAPEDLYNALWDLYIALKGLRLALRDLRLALEDLYKVLWDLYIALKGLRLARRGFRPTGRGGTQVPWGLARGGQGLDYNFRVPTKTSEPRPTVFVSYSHQDEGWKDRVVRHLKVLQMENVLDLWDDGQIGVGDDWLPAIQSSMDRAAVALLLISKDFLTSGFIQETEVPLLLKRRKDEGLRVIPLFVHPCAWQAVDWLAAIQGRPKDAKPLSEHRKPRADKILADLALEIRNWLKEPVREAPHGGAGIKPGVSTPGAIPTTPSPEGAAASARGGNPGRAGDLPASLRDLEMGGGPFPGVETPGFMPAPPAGAPPRLDLGRLPIAGPLRRSRGGARPPRRRLGGPRPPRPHLRSLRRHGQVRAGEPTGWTAWRPTAGAGPPGPGLVLLQPGHRGAGHLRRAVHRPRPGLFGDPDPKAGRPARPRPRLAELVRREKTLLVLDGIEPLQYPLGSTGGAAQGPGPRSVAQGAGRGQPRPVRGHHPRAHRRPGGPSARPRPRRIWRPLPRSRGGAAPPTRRGRGRASSSCPPAAEEFGNHALTLTLLGRLSCAGPTAGTSAAARRWTSPEPTSAGRPRPAGDRRLRRVAGRGSGAGGPAAAGAVRPSGWAQGPGGAAGDAGDSWADRAPDGPGRGSLATGALDTCGSTACWRRPIRSSRRPWTPIPWCGPVSRRSSRSNGRKPGRKATCASTSTSSKEAPDLPDTLEAMQPLYAAVSTAAGRGGSRRRTERSTGGASSGGVSTSAPRSSVPSARI